jgi:DNA-binding NarL/FixJ family response regulator
MSGTPTKGEASMVATKPYRVLIADDHAIVRRGLRAALAGRPGIEVCCEASNGREAVELVKKGKPDLVVLDLTMPEMDGLEAARTIHKQSPDTVILVLTMHFSREIAREVLRSGARGYILKSDADADLAVAIEQLRRGQPVITGKLATAMVESFVSSENLVDATSGPQTGVRLTQREMEIIKFLAQGKSNKEIAINLVLSTRTIESHRHHIMRKMRFCSLSDLVRFAIRQGLVEP